MAKSTGIKFTYIDESDTLIINDNGVTKVYHIDDKKYGSLIKCIFKAIDVLDGEVNSPSGGGSESNVKTFEVLGNNGQYYSSQGTYGGVYSDEFIIGVEYNDNSRALVANFEVSEENIEFFKTNYEIDTFLIVAKNKITTSYKDGDEITTNDPVPVTYEGVTVDWNIRWTETK